MLCRLLRVCLIAFAFAYSTVAVAESRWEYVHPGHELYFDDVEAAVLSMGGRDFATFMVLPDRQMRAYVTLDLGGALPDEMVSVIVLKEQPRKTVEANIKGETLEAVVLASGLTAVGFNLPDGDAEYLMRGLRWEVRGRRSDRATVLFERVISLAGSRAAMSSAMAAAGLIDTQRVPASQPSPGGAARWSEECRVQVEHPWDGDNGGAGVPWDEINAETAIATCRKAIAEGDHSPRNYYHLGRALDRAGNAETLIYLEKASGAGYAIAQNHLGILYRDKEHGLDSQAIARSLFEAAAGRGSLPAKYNLANMMIESGNNEDWALGMRLLRDTADQDYTLGQRKFAEYLASGEAHGSPDYPMALQYYARAADNGDEVSAYRLAEMYRDGVGTDPNPVLYLDYLRWAADNGHKKAREELGLE